MGRFQGALPGTPSARIVSIRCNWHTAWRKSANASPGRPPGRWTDACRANRRKAGPARENPCTRTESGGPGPWPPNFPPEGPEQQGLRRAPFLLVAFVPQVGRASATLDMSDSSPRHCVLHRWGGSAREVRGVPTCRRLRPPQRGSNGAGPSGPAGGGALAALPHRRRLLGRGGGSALGRSFVYTATRHPPPRLVHLRHAPRHSWGMMPPLRHLAGLPAHQLEAARSRPGALPGGVFCRSRGGGRAAHERGHIPPPTSFAADFPPPRPHEHPIYHSMWAKDVGHKAAPPPTPRTPERRSRALRASSRIGPRRPPCAPSACGGSTPTRCSSSSASSGRSGASPPTPGSRGRCCRGSPGSWSSRRALGFGAGLPLRGHGARPESHSGGEWATSCVAGFAFLHLGRSGAASYQSRTTGILI